MKRNSLFTKIAALMLCVMMVIGCLPMSAFAWEGEMDAIENEAELVIGDNTLEVYTGMATTIYSWTATEDGILSITMPNYVGWSYELVNGENVVEGSTEDAEVVANPSIAVAAGDEVTLTVTTNGQTKPVTATIVAEFNYVPGSELNPFELKLYPMEDGTVEAYPSENGYYVANIFDDNWMPIMQGNYIMTVYNAATAVVTYEGVEYTADEGAECIEIPVVANPRAGEISFQIANEEGSGYYISFAMPAGIENNPCVLNVGTADEPASNTANVPAYDYYWFIYNADEDGTVVIDMGDETNYIVASPAYFFEDLIAGEGTSVEFDVIAGESYKFIVLTQDNAADAIVFNAWFEATPEEPEDPVETVPVAQITANGETNGYATVAEALNAATSGQTVTMIADSDESDATLIIKPGVTLYLAAYELKAEYLIGLNGSFVYGDRYIDAGNDGVADAEHAVLNVKPANISLSNGTVYLKESEGRQYIPVWDTANEYYVFTQSRIYNVSPTKSSEDGVESIKFEFSAQFPDVRQNILRDDEKVGIEDNGLSVIVSMTYMQGNVRVTSEFFFTSALQVSQVWENKRLTAALTGCEEFTDLSFTFSIISETGITITTAPYVYDNI